jgi:hypothetical protein
MTKQEKLFQYVDQYVKVTYPESIYQSDELQLGAPEFMEKCVEIIGYFNPYRSCKVMKT